jgi:hypothetical protein
MGAALTYARRYALFTLVGIAGEDDIDAPDLGAPTRTSPSGPDGCGPRKNGGFQTGQEQVSGGQFDGTVSHDRAAKATVSPSPLMLDAAASAALRDRLSDELKSIGSAEEAAMWAQRALGAKSTLIAADAKQIEEAFRERVVAYEAANEVGRRRKARSRKSTRANNNPSIDKSLLVHPEPRRIRDREHVRFLTKQPCLICARTPSDPHHLRFAQHRALGRKVSDEFTVPLCRGHHREIHRCGDEGAWWAKSGIDPSAAARALWLKTHPLPTSPLIKGKDN